MANAESYVGAKLPNGPFIRYDTGVALNMGSSVRSTVPALLPALVLSLRAVRSRGLVESTAGEGERQRERTREEGERREGEEIKERERTKGTERTGKREGGRERGREGEVKVV